MKEPYEFYGSELTVGDCELLALSRVAPQHRQREADLFQRKWFDYRHMHPVKATYLFAHFYQEVMRSTYAETKDKRAAENVTAFRGDIFTGLTGYEMTGVWKARQMFDAFGFRYDFALRFAMKRFTERGWRVFPRPNQLYGEELLLDIRDAWNIECAASLQIPRHERFRVEHFTGHADQIAYREWLIAQIRKRGLPHMALARAINDRLLDKATAEKHFPADVCKRAYTRVIIEG